VTVVTYLLTAAGQKQYDLSECGTFDPVQQLQSSYKDIVINAIKGSTDIQEAKSSVTRWPSAVALTRSSTVSAEWCRRLADCNQGMGLLA